MASFSLSSHHLRCGWFFYCCTNKTRWNSSVASVQFKWTLFAPFLLFPRDNSFRGFFNPRFAVIYGGGRGVVFHTDRIVIIPVVYKYYRNREVRSPGKTSEKREDRRRRSRCRLGRSYITGAGMLPSCHLAVPRRPAAPTPRINFIYTAPVSPCTYITSAVSYSRHLQ